MEMAEKIPSEPDAGNAAEGISRSLLPVISILALKNIIMKLVVNNEVKIFSESSLNLLQLLKQLGIDRKKGIAVSVNNDVIARNQWEYIVLKENDKILIITASQGG